MGLFDKVKTVASSVGNAATDAAATVGGTAMTSAKENTKLLAIKGEIAAIDSQLDIAYAQIGKKYVEQAAATGNVTDIGVMDILNTIEPKLDKKAELEDELIKIEKQLKDQLIMTEKANAQRVFDEEKAKLDKALKMGVMTQDEYNEGMAKAQKKLDNFDQIRRLKGQLSMGVITKSEFEAKMSELGV
jgi:hypothetical protein